MALNKIDLVRAIELVDAVIIAKTSADYDAARAYILQVLMRAWETHG